MVKFIPLSTLYFCPQWWKNIIGIVEDEDPAIDIDIFNNKSNANTKWNKFLEEKLKEEGIIFRNPTGNFAGISFETEQDYLIFKIKYGIQANTGNEEIS